ncbi:hypothetical protein TNCV_3960441 [Trichonephila clavipes]|nr:hypothetical protein TNCV_3960441 [Trichonephila clavipes]
MDIGGVAIYRVEVKPVSSSGNFHFIPSLTRSTKQLVRRKTGSGRFEARILKTMTCKLDWSEESCFNLWDYDDRIVLDTMPVNAP